MSEAAQCWECGEPLVSGYGPLICARCLLGGVAEGGPGRLGMEVPGHEVIEEIARGGMGVVYRARESETERIVALKMLRPRLADEPGMRERFRLEARAVAALDHPSILPVYRVDEAGDLPFFTMKLVSGGTLHERAGSLRGRWREIAGLMAEVADAVHFAHQRGVLHRDIKPANVLFDEAGKPWLSDFGLAKLVNTESGLTRSVAFLGTPRYAAPEVAGRSAAAATAASDCWSMGAMFYELLGGRPPFDAEGSVALLRKIVDDEPEALPPGVPRDLAVICGKCLMKHSGARYGSADAFARDLRHWLAGRPIEARPVGRGEKVWAWARRNPALGAMGVALVAALVFLMVATVREARSARSALTVSKSAQEAARKSEAAAFLNEARAYRRSGNFLERERGLAAALRSWQIEANPEARDEFISLLAMPGIEEDGVTLGDSLLGGWSARADGGLARYAVLTAAGTEIRRVEDGELIAVLPVRPITRYPPGPLSPDGERIVMRMEDRTDILEVATGRLVVSLPALRGTASFSADGGRFLLSPDPGFPGPPVVCDLAGEGPVVVREVTGLPEGWVGLQLAPDGGSFLATPPPRESGLRLVDAVDFGVSRDFKLPGGFSATHMTWSQDGALFVTCSHTGHAVGWDPAREEPLWILNAHDGAMFSAGFFNGNRGLVTVGFDQRTRFWNLITREAAGSLSWPGLMIGQEPGGGRILADDRDRRVRPLLRCSAPEVCAVTCLPAAFIPNVHRIGKPHAIGLPDGGGFAVANGMHLHFLDGDGEVLVKTVVTDQSDAVIFDEGRRRYFYRWQVELVMWDAEGTKWKRVGPVGARSVLALAPAGELLIAGDLREGFRAWRMDEAATAFPEPVDPVELGLPEGARVRCMAWSGDGRWLAWSGDRPGADGGDGRWGCGSGSRDRRAGCGWRQGVGQGRCVLRTGGGWWRFCGMR